MDNVFIYQSAELPDFARSSKGTIGVFFCEWDQLQKAQNRITGKFKHSSLKVKGKCSIKSFNATDPDTGKGFKVLMVEVVEPIAARKARGRPKKTVPVVVPVDASDTLVPPTPDNTEAEDLASKSKDLFDKHLADVSDPKKNVTFWPMY